MSSFGNETLLVWCSRKAAQLSAQLFTFIFENDFFLVSPASTRLESAGSNARAHASTANQRNHCLVSAAASRLDRF